MSLSLPRLMLMASLLSPSMTWALGLGEIHLNSSLNEPMNAEIDLIAAAPDELTALRASLAGRDAFTRYGIDKPPFLNTLTFKVGKGKDGRDALLVRSTDAIPEPFVTFLVEVNWARGRLMREYTVLLDPPVYSPGERASSAPPVSAPTNTAQPVIPTPRASTPRTTAPAAEPPAPRASRRSSSSSAASPAAPAAADALGSNGYHVAPGDTLTKIVRSLHAGTPSDIDQTMIAVYRANPDAFGGNINILKRGAVLRVPGADEIAALNQTEAMSEVRRQMSAWRGGAGAEPSGHLRLVTPGAGTGTGTGTGTTAENAGSNPDNQALRGRVKDLEGQLADSRRLLEVRNNELAELQRKLGKTPSTAPTPVPVPAPAPSQPTATTPPPATATPAPVQPTPSPTEPAASSAPVTTEPPVAEAPPVVTPVPTPVKKPTPAPAVDSGSWVDWISANWWLPAAVLVVALLGLALFAWRRRQAASSNFPGFDNNNFDDYRDPGNPPGGRGRGRDDSFVVEESGEHRMPPELGGQESFGETTSDLKASDDTMSSESAVNLDQGDPLAEADFHMAYGLYDQAADLVRIALEREPDRRDLRMKLLEIYFVWGNKDQFLQTAKTLESTRDRAPAGEWDKIVIMGKQICPEEPMFQQTTGSGRGAGALVDLNLEGGENRVDIDLFGEPEGERSSSHITHANDEASTGESPRLHADSDLDFTLDTPERGADDSPTREMPPRDEPTVESELMSFVDSSTAESPTIRTADRDRPATRSPPLRTDQTAEVSIDDLGLDLENLDHSSSTNARLEETDHPSDAPTMVAGLDEKSRRMMAEAESRTRDKDLTELERELEASFIADIGSEQDEVKTAVLGPESAPTVQMPRNTTDFDVAATSRFKSPEFSDIGDADRMDIDSTSKLRGIGSDSIDLDLDRLASALGSGDTVEQPRAEDDVFSSEVFEASQKNRGVDLDVGDALSGSEAPTNKLKAISTNSTNKISPDDLALPELEPVTMSEVGTKLDLARAYMDMGDPEGARSILEEVVSEGSASQKQEAQRLIEALPG
jgi:pilus assembly protein FimV